MTYFLQPPYTLGLRILDDPFLEESVMQGNVYVLVNRRCDNESAVLAVVLREVGAAASQ